MSLPLDILSLLESSGALRHGHFQLSSGRHAREYVQCALLLERPERARLIGGSLASLLAPYTPQTIVSPALGGLIIGYEVAAALGVTFRFTERVGGSMELRRGFSLAQGERVAVVEDVVTTGRSTVETCAALSASGAEVVAIGAIIDRTAAGGPFEIPFESLARVVLDSFSPDECPLCLSNSAVEKPGSRQGE